MTSPTSSAAVLGSWPLPSSSKAAEPQCALVLPVPPAPNSHISPCLPLIRVLALALRKGSPRSSPVIVHLHILTIITSAEAPVPEETFIGSGHGKVAILGPLFNPPHTVNGITILLFLKVTKSPQQPDFPLLKLPFDPAENLSTLKIYQGSGQSLPPLWPAAVHA